MKCLNCSAVIQDNSEFCGQCGTPNSITQESTNSDMTVIQKIDVVSAGKIGIIFGALIGFLIGILYFIIFLWITEWFLALAGWLVCFIGYTIFIAITSMLYALLYNISARKVGGLKLYLKREVTSKNS